jgi:hypothetical protein
MRFGVLVRSTAKVRQTVHRPREYLAYVGSVGPGEDLCRFLEETRGMLHALVDACIVIACTLNLAAQPGVVVQGARTSTSLKSHLGNMMRLTG